MAVFPTHSMELPIFEMKINEDLNSDLEVQYVALVDRPAIQKNFLAFKDIPQAFATVDEDRRIISGPAMLADQPIYRKDEQLGEYLVVFKADTIFSIAQKFFQKGFNSNFNLMHDPKQKCEGVTVFESFIVDSTRGIKPMAGFEDAKDGSWFISAKVSDDNVWAKVKAGEIRGFSVEGVFGYKPELTPEEKFMAQILEIINGK